MSNERVLVVSDDLGMAWRLMPTLNDEGFDVEAASSKSGALAMIERHRPLATVIDVSPRIQSATALHRLSNRARQYGPVLWLVEHPDDRTEEHYEGSCLIKPFSVYELVLQVREHLRAGRSFGGPPVQLTYGDLEIDETLRRVTAGPVAIDLTPTEFRLLHLLVSRAPRVLTRAQIADLVFDYGFTGSDKVVETYVSYLRRKLDRVTPGLVETMRGAGYRAHPAPR